MRNINNRSETNATKYNENRLVSAYAPVNTTFFQKDPNGRTIIDYDLFMDKYYHQIYNNTELMEIEESDFKNVKYRPWDLSVQLYQTEDMWRLILAFNGMSHPAEFDKRIVRTMTLEGYQALRRIYLHEEDYIKKNHIVNDIQK